VVADAFVWTSSAALPVPEPSMAWMLGPGLPLPGWRGRAGRDSAGRQRRHRQGRQVDVSYATSNFGEFLNLYG
jgi:hypothetical protein